MMLPADAAMAMGAVFVVSIVGSAHCAGMCGPLALAACSTGGRGNCGGSVGLGQWSYHAARGASYAAIGAIAGGVGSLADSAGSMAQVQHLTAVMAGATLILVGVAMLLKWRGVPVPSLGFPRWLMDPVRRVHTSALRRPPRTRAIMLGLVTPLLPCGWLWAFVAFAAGTGHPLSGGIVLVAFWAGTVPAVAAVVGGTRLATLAISRHGLGRWIQPAVALLLIGVGVETAVHRAAIADRVMSIVVREMDPASDRQVSLGLRDHTVDTRPACCRDDDEHTDDEPPRTQAAP